MCDLIIKCAQFAYFHAFFKVTSVRIKFIQVLDFDKLQFVGKQNEHKYKVIVKRTF